jgi:cardiolipin synthase (CMP-forming)
LIAGEAGDRILPMEFGNGEGLVSRAGILLLWLSALLTLYTGYDYMRAGLRYMMDD